MPAYTVIQTLNELGKTKQLYKRSYSRIDHYLAPNELARALHNVQQDCKRHTNKGKKSMKQKKSAIIRNLRQELAILRADRPFTLSEAYKNTSYASIDKLMGSGCTLELKGVGGLNIIPMVLIADGLSRTTIDAIKADIKRSMELKRLPTLK